MMLAEAERQGRRAGAGRVGRLYPVVEGAAGRGGLKRRRRRGRRPRARSATRRKKRRRANKSGRRSSRTSPGSGRTARPWTPRTPRRSPRGRPRRLSCGKSRGSRASTARQLFRLDSFINRTTDSFRRAGRGSPERGARDRRAAGGPARERDGRLGPARGRVAPGHGGKDGDQGVTIAGRSLQQITGRLGPALVGVGFGLESLARGGDSASSGLRTALRSVATFATFFGPEGFIVAGVAAVTAGILDLFSKARDEVEATRKKFVRSTGHGRGRRLRGPAGPAQEDQHRHNHRRRQPAGQGGQGPRRVAAGGHSRSTRRWTRSGAGRISPPSRSSGASRRRWTSCAPTITQRSRTSTPSAPRSTRSRPRTPSSSPPSRSRRATRPRTRKRRSRSSPHRSASWTRRSSA
jgi:hypothetical protein